MYATAFVLASNATEGMYSMKPWKGRQLCLLWLYLAFIITSQLLILFSLLFVHPPVISSQTTLVDCDAPNEAARAALEAPTPAELGKGRLGQLVDLGVNTARTLPTVLPAILPAMLNQTEHTTRGGMALPRHCHAPVRTNPFEFSHRIFGVRCATHGTQWQRRPSQLTVRRARRKRSFVFMVTAGTSAL